jgi:hypothetical protein
MRLPARLTLFFRAASQARPHSRHGGYIRCEITTAKIVRTNITPKHKGTKGASEGSRLMCRQRWLTEVCSLFALTPKEARHVSRGPGFFARSQRLTRRNWRNTAPE